MRELLIAGLILVVGGVVAYLILRPRPDPRVEALAKSVGLGGPVVDIRVDLGGGGVDVIAGDTNPFDDARSVSTIPVHSEQRTETAPAPAPVTTTAGTLRGTTQAPLTAPLLSSIKSTVGF